MCVEFKILGRLEVLVNGSPSPIAGVKPRMLLATLLLSLGQVVPPGRVTEALWPEGAPRSAVENLRTYAAGIRRTWAGHCSDQAALPTLSVGRSGHRLVAEPDSLDLTRFRQALGTGRSELERSPEAAAYHADRALGLWRGRAAEDLPREGWLGRCLASLDELHLTAVELRGRAWLALGRHAELLPELHRLVAEHPLREELWRQLMLAQYRSGAAAEALCTYARAREEFARELGADPGPELAELHQAVLRGDDGLRHQEPPCTGAGGTPSRVPHRLPPAPADLAGRPTARAAVVRALAAALADPTRPAIVSVSGAPGAGKSALALACAQALTEDYPDGQLYLDLRAERAKRPSAGEDRAAVAVVLRLIRALGGTSPGSMTARDMGACDMGACEASGLLRDLLAGRRILLVLDNASHEDEVSPLLPAHPGAGVLVTGLRPLYLPEVTRHVALEPMAGPEAAQLLARRAGLQRVAADPKATAELAELCSGLPIALSAAAHRLVARPAWTVRELCERLKPVHRRLDELDAAAGPRTVRAVLQDAVDEVSRQRPGAARLLHDLACLPGEFDLAGVRTLVRDHDGSPATALETLQDFGLLRPTAAGRHVVPELLRIHLVQSRRQIVPRRAGRPSRTGRPVRHMSPDLYRSRLAFRHDHRQTMTGGPK